MLTALTGPGPREHGPRSALARAPFLRALHYFPLMLAAVLLATPRWADAQVAPETTGPAGEWRGAIAIPGSPLEVVVDLRATADGAWTGSIDIPAQGADDQPLTGIQVAEDSVAFAIEGVPGAPTFRGALADNGATLAGIFTQGPQTFPFELTRAGAVDIGAALEGLDGWLTEHMAAWSVPGVALGIVHRGEVVHLSGHGLRNVEDSLRVTPATLFAIGSTTKAFTSALLGTFVDEGALDWDEPVRAHIPELVLADTAVSSMLTVRDLLTHRSGLPRHDAIWYANPSLSRSELVERMAHLPLSRGLRTTWQYNNLMFVLAGEVAARIGETSWEELVRARLLEPLDMDRSNFSVAESGSDPNHALGYSEHEDTLVRVPLKPLEAVAPAGAINSTAEDMVGWVRLHLAEGVLGDSAVLQPGTVQAMQTPSMFISSRPGDPAIGVRSYGLGWFVDSYRGHFRVHHGGNIDGFSAALALYPHDDLGIVVLTNKNATPMPEFAALHVADRILGLEPRDWSGEALAARDGPDLPADSMAPQAEREPDDPAAPEEGRVEGTLPSHEMGAYVGSFRHPGYGTITVRASGTEPDDLQIGYYDLTLELEHVHYDVFVTRDPAEMSPFAGLRVRFSTGFDGMISALAFPIEPTLPPGIFERAPDERLTDPSFLDRLTGRYSALGQTIEVGRRGDRLVVTIPGQPPYVLVAARETSFTLEAVSQIRVSFDVPDTEQPAAATAVTFHQPNGTFRYERVEG